MRWPKSKQTANEGVIYVETVVNAAGQIFRAVPQETDVGVDAYIELVKSEQCLGQLIAVQIKSGSSYVDQARKAFRVVVTPERVEYWSLYAVPVILVCYSAADKLAAWMPIRDYLSTNSTAIQVRP
jgi:hypothetical protein